MNILQCPLNFWLGIPCPACGSTRAMLALLRGDIAGYMFYNPAALSVIAIVLAEFLPTKVKRIMQIYSFILLVVVFLYRLWIHHPILMYSEGMIVKLMNVFRG